MSKTKGVKVGAINAGPGRARDQRHGTPNHALDQCYDTNFIKVQLPEITALGKSRRVRSKQCYQQPPWRPEFIGRCASTPHDNPHIRKVQ